VSLTKALQFLNESKVGDFIIRPSSRGILFLTITWKFNEGIYVHLPLKEEKINTITSYLLGKRMYESLDEIIE
jgi:hypothetical protein